VGAVVVARRAISSGSVIAIYLYGLVKSARKPALARVPAGLPGASRPEALRVSSSLWLIVAEAPLDTYGSGPLEARLSDMDWVGRVALAHEDVVESFARRSATTIIPMKLFTMFSTRERAVADVVARRRSIDAVMRRIAGAEEWGVRVMRTDAVTAAAPPRPAASGSAFLAAKKQARDAARDARATAAAAAFDAFDRLARLARDARRRELDPPAGTRPPLLDAAFLVPTTGRARFTQAARREVAACTWAGAVMTLSGPWPAYNFVQPEEPAR
jgi:hypothetical protein